MNITNQFMWPCLTSVTTCDVCGNCDKCDNCGNVWQWWQCVTMVTICYNVCQLWQYVKIVTTCENFDYLHASSLTTFIKWLIYVTTKTSITTCDNMWWWWQDVTMLAKCVLMKNCHNLCLVWLHWELTFIMGGGNSTEYHCIVWVFGMTHDFGTKAINNSFQVER